MQVVKTKLCYTLGQPNCTYVFLGCDIMISNKIKFLQKLKFYTSLISTQVLRNTPFFFFLFFNQKYLPFYIYMYITIIYGIYIVQNYVTSKSKSIRQWTNCMLSQTMPRNRITCAIRSLGPIVDLNYDNKKRLGHDHDNTILCLSLKPICLTLSFKLKVETRR